MKTIKKLTLTITGCVLLSTQVVFADITTRDLSLFGDRMSTSIASAASSTNKQIADSLNALFVSMGSTTSIIDKSLGQYTKDFLKVYTFKTFNFVSPITFAKSGDLDQLYIQSFKKLMAQQIGYNTQKNIVETTWDTKGLLAQPFEGGGSDFNPAYLGIVGVPSQPYGSLDDKSPVAEKAPNITDLIGAYTYQEDKKNNEKDKAKLFLQYVLQAIPLPKNFYIPGIDKASDDGGKKSITIYIPEASEDASYTTKTVSIEKNIEKYKDEPLQIEYDRMIAYLNAEQKYYQPYKLKVRTTNVLRTLYTECLYRAYQDRVKDPRTGKSLAEKERDMAFAGVNNSEYYDNLKGNKDKGIQPATIAEVVIESLQSVNKLVYFVYKLHQDIERLSLIMSTSSMQTISGQQSIEDDPKYIKPISTMIKNACWDKKYASDQVKKLCDDPRLGMQQAK